MASVKTAEDILKENIESWGEGRETFTVSLDEVRIIIASAGSIIKELNRVNGDGTFFTLVKYHDKFFNCSSSSEV